MSLIQKIQSTPDTSYPHVSELYPYAVRVDCTDPADNSESLGSGVLFHNDGKFMVLTAEHCIRKNDTDLFPIENIAFRFADNEQTSFHAVRLLKSDKDADFALLEVNFIPNEFQRDDYLINSLFFVGRPFSPKTMTYGYSVVYPKGRGLKVENISPKTYRILEPIYASGREMEMIRGFSGSGIFTKVGSRIICEGYITGKIDSFERMEEISVAHIPELGESVWRKSFDPELGSGPYISWGNNKAKIEYINAWRKLLDKIRNGGDCTAEINDIREKRKAYPLSQSDSLQDQVVWYLIHKDEAWSDSDRDAFLFALSDMGQWPALYGKLPDNAGNLEKRPACLPLLHRGATLSLDESIEPCALNVEIDDEYYESILRALFRFDFNAALNLCIAWSPSGIFLAKKLMLLHLLGKKDDELEKKLDERIKEKPDGLEVAFIETVIANQYCFSFPPKHKYEDFNKSGLDSPGTVLKSIFNNIDKPDGKFKVYGVHTTELISTGDTTSFPSALRVINYIIESGIPPSDGFAWTISTQNWLKLFLHLFRNFPYPAVFYSLLYRDEKLMRRIGQEMAYADDEDFRKVLPDILSRLLKSLVDEATPRRMVSSIFQMTSELFCSVDSKSWEADFYNSLQTFFDSVELSGLSYRDDIVKFIINGMSSLKRSHERIKVISLIVEKFTHNPILFSYILVNGLNFDDVLASDKDFARLIDKITAENTFKEIALLIAELSFRNLLSDNQKNNIFAKIEAEGLQFAGNNKEELHNLTFIVPEQFRSRLKDMILELDIWDCGIRPGSYHSIDVFEIEKISESIVWTESEQNIILDNLEKNLSVIEDIDEGGHARRYLKASAIQQLGRMFRYLSGTKFTTNKNIESLKNRVEKELSKWTSCDSILERLVEGDYNQIIDAHHSMIQSAEFHGPEAISAEIEYVLNSILAKNKNALSSSIGLISYLCSTYPGEMIQKYGSRLTLILKSYCQYDYELLELKVPDVNRELTKIAKALSSLNINEAPVRYWLSDDVVNRFY